MNGAVTDSDGLGLSSIRNSIKVAAMGALRTAPLWLLAGIVTFVAVGRIQESQADDPTATAELGLTGQVVWPFFEVVLSETEARAIEVEPQVRTSLGTSFVDYEVRRPNNIGLIEVRVTATTEQMARDGVSLAVDEIIEDDFAAVTQRVNDQRDAQLLAEAEASEQLADILQQIEDRTAQFVPNLDESTRRLLDQQIQVLQAERDSAQRSQLRAREEIQQLDVELQTSISQVEVSNLTSSADPVGSSRSLQLAAAIGVATALALALNVFQREQGRILNPAHVRSVLGLPALSFPETPTTAVAVARLLYALREESNARIIGVASVPTGADAAHQMSLALKSIGEDVLVTEFGFDSTDDNSVAFSVLDPFDSTTIDAQMACDAVIVVAWERSTALWDLRRKINELEERGLPVRGVLLRREN